MASASTAPIFVVGLPRSGSTLIEQILASHSAVEGTQELADVPRFVLELQGRDPDFESPRYPGVLAQLLRGGLPALRREVSARHPRLSHRQAEVHRQDAEQLPAPRFHPPAVPECEDHRCPPRADGLLLRQPQAALCARPGVRLQHRRHRPLLPHLPRADGALGCGAAGHRAARSCTRTWSRTSRATSGASSISASCPSSRHASSSTAPSAASVTASSEQVRQPIFREGLDQWRHYEAWLVRCARRSATRSCATEASAPLRCPDATRRAPAAAAANSSTAAAGRSGPQKPGSSARVCSHLARRSRRRACSTGRPSASLAQPLLRPEFAEAHNDLGQVLLRLGRTDAAIASCQRALALRPRFAAAMGNLANAETRPRRARGRHRRISTRDRARARTRRGPSQPRQCAARDRRPCRGDRLLAKGD